MKSIPEILLFSTASTATESFLPSADKLLAGRPQQTIRNHFSDKSGQFHSGEWTGDVGEWKVAYTEEEFCFITRGKVLIRSDAGVEVLVQAGDAFVIPSGFSGVWKVLESVHKYYVIFETV